MSNCIHWVKWEDCQICNPKKKGMVRPPKTSQEREKEQKKREDNPENKRG